MKKKGTVLFIPHGGGPLPILGDSRHKEIIKFLKKNLSEQDPNSGERVEYFIFCSKTNTTQKTCKRNIRKDYQYKITWNRIINQIKIYKYRKDHEWVLIDG